VRRAILPGFRLILLVHQSSLRNSEALLRRLLPS